MKEGFKMKLSNEDLELLYIKNFDKLITRYDFKEIWNGVKTADIDEPENKYTNERVNLVLELFENYSPIIDITYEELVEFNELINGHVRAFFLAFYKHFFIEKVQNIIV